MTAEQMENLQENICQKYNAAYRAPNLKKIVGVSNNLKNSTPINGLRHPSTETTEGWYIWSGEWSDDKQFFQPVHLEHLVQQHPELLPYIGLPPGWRFLIDPKTGHEDVWQDNGLLDIG